MDEQESQAIYRIEYEITLLKFIVDILINLHVFSDRGCLEIKTGFGFVSHKTKMMIT